MHHRLRSLVVLTAAVLTLGPAALLAPAPTPVLAAAPTAQITGVENKFPSEILFTAEAASPGSRITSLRFHMTVGPGQAERLDNFEFTPGPQVTGKYTLKVAGNNYIPPGSTLTYWADAQDAAGATVISEKQTYWYADTRFQWSKLQEGTVTLYYYGAAERTARSVMQAAHEVQDNTGELLGVQGHPFTLMLYNTPSDIIGAQQVETSEKRSQELIRVGIAYPGSDLVQVLAASGFGGPDTTRHEVTHLFVSWAAGNGVPTWLNEGLAVWAQNDPGSDYRNSLDEAIKDDKLLLLRGMESFPGNSKDTLLAYGESWSAVKYLIDTYGRAKFREFYLSMGKIGTEPALKATFGVSYDELDAAWRKSVGAPPRSYAISRPTAIPVFGGGDAADAPKPAATPAPSGNAAAPLPMGALAAGGAVVLLVIAAGVFASTRKKAR